MVLNQVLRFLYIDNHFQQHTSLQESDVNVLRVNVALPTAALNEVILPLKFQMSLISFISL